MRLPRLALWMSVLLVMIALAYSYSVLPAEVVSNFGPDGTPNKSTMSKESNLLLGALLHLFFSTMPLWTIALMRAVPPRWCSMPHNEYWLAPERREITLEITRNYMDIFATGCNLFFICLGGMVTRANLIDPPHLPTQAFFVVLGMFLGFTLGWTVHFVLRWNKVPNEVKLAENQSDEDDDSP